MPKINSINKQAVSNLSVGDFILESYDPIDSIKAPMAV